jgi:predicted flap endonuclease-1-like 5' DNA nuclease
VIAIWLGERIQETIGQRAGPELHPLIPVTLGALLLTGVSFFAWSVLPCLGLIVAVLLGSTGVGAVLVYLARRSNFGGGSWSGGSIGDSPTPPSTPPSGSAVAVVPAGEPVDVPRADVAVTTAPATEATEEGFTPSETLPGEIAATGILPEDDAPVVSTPAEVEGSGFVTGEELGLSDEERRQLRQGAGIVTEPDNFLRIRGIGPTFNGKLLATGVTTYRQLAAMSPEEIAGIVGWPSERVIRDQLREQAAELAEQG